MYHNLAPNIFRKRFIIEGKYQKEIQNLDFLYNFLFDLSYQIHDGNQKIRGIRGPFVFDYRFDEKVGDKSSYDGFIIWNENQASSYIWHDEKFFTLDLYTCSEFDTNALIVFVRDYFLTGDNITWHELPQPAPFEESPLVELKSIGGALGVGVFAKELIPKETFITYIDGEILYAKKESELSDIRLSTKDHAVPFSQYFYRNAFNSIAVKINHSCDPNCYVRDNFCIYTMRDISLGEELTMSYSLFCNSDWKVPGGKCLCGSAHCLGDILPWRDLPSEYKKKYLSYTADWIIFEEMKKEGYIDLLKERL